MNYKNTMENIEATKGLKRSKENCMCGCGHVRECSVNT